MNKTSPGSHGLVEAGQGFGSGGPETKQHEVSVSWIWAFPDAFISRQCSNKSPQMLWLTRGDIFSLAVLETRSLKRVLAWFKVSQAWKLRGRALSLPFPAPGGCQQSLVCGRITPVSAFVVTSPPLLSNLPLPPFEKNTCDGAQATRIHQDNLTILNLTAPAKPLLQSQVTLGSPGWGLDIFGGRYSATTPAILHYDIPGGVLLRSLAHPRETSCQWPLGLWSVD